LKLRVSEPAGAVEAVLRRWRKDVGEYIGDRLGRDRARDFNQASGRASIYFTPNCPEERRRQILAIQGKVDYLAELSKRLVELGPPE